MRKVTPSLLTLVSFLTSFSAPLLQAQEKAASPASASVEPMTAAKPSSSFAPFTGKVTKNKVRLRLQPNFDGAVVRELSKDELLIARGETEDFYAIQPSPDMKAYVYRTYVLDNVIEGTKVNVRLKPDLDAPVIAQLNSGDRVNGFIDASNNKWLEISIPDSTYFYIAKEYLDKVGDAGLIARTEKRKEEVTRLLNTTNAVSTTEMQKPFDQINLDGIVANYKHIMLDYPDFPEIGNKAKDMLTALQEAYTQKKIYYLESQTHQSSIVMETKNKQLADELRAHKTKLSQLEQRLQKEANLAQSLSPSTPRPKTVSVPAYPVNMLAWMPVEDNLFASWSQQQPGDSTLENFYQEQKQKAFILRGIISPYDRAVRNKPGDYMLANSASKLPIGFLYSTKVNLQEYVGHEVSIIVSPRPNNHFAYPAYFVLSVE
jgi:hypothetical protein